MRIIDIELYKLNDNLKRNETEYKELSLKFDKSIKEYIYKHGIDENYGARPLRRCIEKDIATPLARKILSESIDPKAAVEVSAKKSKVKFNIIKKEDANIYLTDSYQAAGAEPKPE